MKRIIKLMVLLCCWVGLASVCLIKTQAAYNSNYTYTNVPDNYYAGLDTNQSSENFKRDLSAIITKNFVHCSYSQVYNQILPKSDVDPNDSSKVICIYTGVSYDVGTSGNDRLWNREHVWAKSHGFPSDTTDPYSDAHHLRASEIKINANRSNSDFGELDGVSGVSSDSYGNRWTSSIFEPRDEVKGDIARMMLYMQTRYGYESPYNLTLIESYPTSLSDNNGVFGNLNTLLKWHYEDPVSESEIYRNNVIYEDFQHNRNPYIDHPEWVSIAYPNEFGGAQKTDVEKVIEAIQGLPTYVTFSDEAKVVEVQNAYNALTADEKKQVTNVNILNLAVTTIQSLYEFTNVQTKASLKIVADSQMNPVDVDLRFGGIIPKSAYHSDASYGVLVTANMALELEQFYENQSVLDLIYSNNEFKSMLCSPARVSQNASGDYVVDADGDAYQYAWVITDMEGHYSTVLKAYVYMEYQGSLYIGIARSYSVEDLAKYYFVNRESLGLTENQIKMIKKLIPNSHFGEEYPGDVLKDYWT